MKLRDGLTISAALICGAAALGGAVWNGAPAVAQPATAPAAIDDEACAKLAGLKLDGVEIVSARSQPAGAPVEGAKLYGPMFGKPDYGPVASGLPAFCRVIGRIHPTPASDIRFEVWMPAQGWDGRMSGVGVGGFAGSIDYLTMGLALKGGQVGVSTDTGHIGGMQESNWAKGHPERVRDYGWRGIHETAVAAKKLVAALYGRAPHRSYFIGCSGGGRAALMEASRFPEDYDGILAGAPAAVWTDLAIAMINPVQAQLAPGAAIRASQVHLLQDEVLRQCDARDGQVDGLVADPRRCNLDISKLTCGHNSSPQCFSPAQVAALKKIYAGPHDSAGRQLAGGYLPGGSETGTPLRITGWDGYILAGPDGRSGNEVLVGGLLKDVVQEPFATPETFDFDKDPQRLKASLAEDLDAKPDLRRFFSRGGKLILWHGWADAAIPPEHTLWFREAILKASGPRAAASMQLFMVPGVQHCMGGTGPNAFNALNAPQPRDTPDRSMAAALQVWVETGRKPETLIGRRGDRGLMGVTDPDRERQRLLCAYPEEAVLKRDADPDKAASYTCEAPRKTSRAIPTANERETGWR